MPKAGTAPVLRPDNYEQTLGTRVCCHVLKKLLFCLSFWRISFNARFKSTSSSISAPRSATEMLSSNYPFPQFTKTGGRIRLLV